MKIQKAFVMIALLSSLCVQAAKRPNVVVLLSDDLGSTDLGCYGGPVNTPALDGLAAKGVRFETFYAGSAVCSPSRAVLLTGRHHIRAGVYNWIYDQTQNAHLLERETTIAELLKGAGYETAHMGKWHLGSPMEGRKKPTPAQHGFDYWFATANNAEPSHHNPVNFIRNGEALGKLEGYACQLVVDEAIHWLDNHRDTSAPFFLNVWFHEPHQRIAAPAEQVAANQGPGHTAGLGGKQKKEAPLYSATIENSDRAVARLLKKLSEVAPPEDTLVIYASDNGSYMENRNGTLRGHKGVNWEGGLRVPGIFCWPGTIPAGKVAHTPVGVVDVLPTLCALLEIERPKVHLDGADVSSVLLGDGSGLVRHQPFFWQLYRSDPIVAIRDGDYALIGKRDNKDLPLTNRMVEDWIPLIKQGGYKDYELYNLAKDPNQTTNIANRFPEKLGELKKKLMEINASVMADGPDWHLKGE